MAVVIPAISSKDLLACFRGPITKARPAYPETIQLQLTDVNGSEWWFVTWDADYSPSDPASFVGKTVVRAEVDERSGDLTIGFSDDSKLEITPSPQEDELIDDPAYWELFTPDGLVLAYGPMRRWTLGLATDPV